MCVGIGVLAGINPEYGLIGALGVMLAVITIMDLTLGFVLFTIASFLDLTSSTGSFSGIKVVGLVLFVSWLARIGTRRSTELGSFAAENPMLAMSLVAMLAWATLSFAWAFSPSTALGGAGRYALNMMLLPIGFAAMRERRHVAWVLAAYVVGAALSAVYGFATSSATGFSGRLTGSIGDPNAEATVLAASIPLLIGVVGMFRPSARTKLVAIVVGIILFAGLFSTVSREGLVALAAVMIGAVVFGGRWRGRAAALLAIGVCVTVGYFFVLAPLAARQRVTMADTSGRSSIWTVAWRVVEAHPVLGVGNDNFILVEGRYVNQPGAVLATYIIGNPRVVHNAYLEALADLGIPGLLTLLAVLALSLGAGIRAAWMFERLGDREMELVSRCVVLAIIAVLTAALFVSSEYGKYLWLLLAVCPALLALARRTTPQVATS
ncbi:MAG TPA: O-antigen ligase family protein [Solirubrobacteraceae bacterium]|nr:O-antigen ligase family protein [Solirubrobacteraceae bacterium]